MKGKTGKSFEKLVQLMAKLREPGGCPWDREQTLSSLRQYVIEEAYEVVDAINSGETSKIIEELGDYLLQVVFISRIGEEEGTFNINDVIESINAKLIRRHPHVFGDEKIHTPEEVLRRWREIKKKETLSQRLPFENSFPSTLKALKAGKWASEFGYDWESSEGVLEKIKEEVEEISSEIKHNPSHETVEHEIGDLLFSCVNLARKLKIDPEVALLGSVEKFISRIKTALKLIENDGKEPSRLSQEELDSYWTRAKKSQEIEE